MTSERQAAANRRNALYSTGPRTAAGKMVAARNGLRHGILAGGPPVLPGVECAEEWEEHCEGVVASLGPVGVLERRLAERVAELLWRMGRVARYECAVVAVRLDEAADALDGPEAGCEGGEADALERCRTELARAEEQWQALARLAEGDGDAALTANEARAVLDAVMAVLRRGAPAEEYAGDPSFWRAGSRVNHRHTLGSRRRNRSRRPPFRICSGRVAHTARRTVAHGYNDIGGG